MKDLQELIRVDVSGDVAHKHVAARGALSRDQVG